MMSVPLNEFDTKKKFLPNNPILASILDIKISNMQRIAKMILQLIFNLTDGRCSEDLRYTKRLKECGDST